MKHKSHTEDMQKIMPSRMPKMPAVKAPRKPTGMICGATGAPVPSFCEYCVNHRCDGYKEWEKMSEGVSTGTSGTIQDVSALSVCEERETGKWIFIRDEENGNALYECPVCHKGDIHAPEVEVKYCWNCGARMEGSKDE